MENVTSQNYVSEEKEEVEEEKSIEKLIDEVIQTCKAESINYPSECYEFVERCLRVKDCDVKKAVNLVLGFGNAVKVFKYLLTKHDIEKSATLHINGVVSLLKTSDVFGRKVFWFKLGQWNPKQVEYDQLCVTIMLLFVWVVGQSKHFQRTGVVAIADMSSFGLEHIRSVSMKTLTKAVRLMNDSSPGKIKGIHFIYHARVFGPLFKLVKPLLKEKLSKRIHFHGDNTTSLQQHFQPEILPKSLGGKLGEVEAVDDDLISRFVADESYASEMDRLGFPKQ